MPVRLELGPRDMDKQACILARRDTGQKAPAPWQGVTAQVRELLDDIQVGQPLFQCCSWLAFCEMACPWRAKDKWPGRGLAKTRQQKRRCLDRPASATHLAMIFVQRVGTMAHNGSSSQAKIHPRMPVLYV